MHRFWRIERFAVLLGAAPFRNQADALLTEECIAVAALLRVWLYNKVAKATNEVLQCRLQR